MRNTIRRWKISRISTVLLLAGLSLILLELLVLLSGFLTLAAESIFVARHHYLPHLEVILLSLALLIGGTYLVEHMLRDQEDQDDPHNR